MCPIFCAVYILFSQYVFSFRTVLFFILSQKNRFGKINEKQYFNSTEKKKNRDKQPLLFYEYYINFIKNKNSK